MSSVGDVLKIVEEIKKKDRKRRLETNYYVNEPDGEVQECCQYNDTIVFSVKRNFKTSLFYFYDEVDNLIEALKRIKMPCLLERIHNEETDDLRDKLSVAGFNYFTTYRRTTVKYKINPYSIPETGRRAILGKYYDKTKREYPAKEDIKECMELYARNFDPRKDDFFTESEWEGIVERKECLIAREDGKIVALYMARIIGKKFYSNASINEGAANLLYNLERSEFERVYDMGIRVYYGWANINYGTALNRGAPRYKEAEEYRQYLYNSIYEFVGR